MSSCLVSMQRWELFPRGTLWDMKMSRMGQKHALLVAPNEVGNAPENEPSSLNCGNAPDCRPTGVGRGAFG